MRTWMLLNVVLIAGCGGGGSSSPEPSTAGPAAVVEHRSLAMNLAAVEYWSSELVFTNAFSHSSEWIPQTTAGTWPWDTGQPFAGFTSDGYPLLQPGQAAAALVFRGLSGRYPAGVYTCLYDGSGTLDFRADGAIVNAAPGQVLVNVTPSSEGILVRITASDPADPVRNVRLYPPGADPSQVFHRRFLDRWSGFGAVRFMEWQETNHSPLRDWSERSTPSWHSQATWRGVALEHQILAANELRADAWFCIPHLATDEFVREFATLVRDRLDAGLRAYVEYSNEVWNAQFGQAQYAQQQGLALQLSTNGFQAQLRYYAQRSVEIFRIFESVFGGRERLIFVLAAQSANPWTSTQVLDWQQAYLEADVLAIAPYFGVRATAANEAAVEAMTVAEVLDACREDIAVQMAFVSQHVQTAQARGLATVCYEAGQHCVAVGSAQDNATITALFAAANRDAGMRDVYRDYLDAWRVSGGTAMFLFTSMRPSSRYGSFGVFEYEDEETTPKFEALREFIERTPRWW